MQKTQKRVRDLKILRYNELSPAQIEATLGGFRTANPAVLIEQIYLYNDTVNGLSNTLNSNFTVSSATPAGLDAEITTFKTNNPTAVITNMSIVVVGALYSVFFNYAASLTSFNEQTMSMWILYYDNVN